MAEEKVYTPQESAEMLQYLVLNAVTKQDLELQLKPIATKEDLKAYATKEDLKNELKAYATKEDLKNELKTTKDEIREMFGEFKHELKDHVTKQVAKVGDRFYEIAERQNEKTNKFIETAQKSGTISKKDAIQLIEINPLRAS